MNLIEIEAVNFVLYIGHLGRREPVVQPTMSRMKEVAHQAFTYGVCGDGGYGGDVDGDGYASVRQGW